MESAFRVTRAHLVSHSADEDWCVMPISLFSPEYEIFAKGYVPPNAQSRMLNKG